MPYWILSQVGASFSLGQLEKDEVVISRHLAELLSALGPTFVKLGQVRLFCLFACKWSCLTVAPHWWDTMMLPSPCSC
jgi:hypothetical protein